VAFGDDEGLDNYYEDQNIDVDSYYYDDAAAGDDSIDYEQVVETDFQKRFLKDNKKKSGVTTLGSGLQYEVIESVNNRESLPSPGPKTPCRIHYEGSTIDGSVFDSSYERGKPAVFRPESLVAGFKQALMMMKAGETWRVVVPAELAYGDKGSGEKIPPKATLIFTVKLLEVDPDFGLYEQLAMKMTEKVPGMPLQWWQTFAFGFYLFIRIYLKFGGGGFSGGSSGKTCEARHILVNDEKLANELKTKLTKKPKEFAKLAAEHSKCPSGKKGGSLGKFSPGQMVPAFDKVCFDPDIKLGEVVGPVKTQFGYHLISVDKRTGFEPPVEEESKKEK